MARGSAWALRAAVFGGTKPLFASLCPSPSAGGQVLPHEPAGCRWCSVLRCCFLSRVWKSTPQRRAARTPPQPEARGSHEISRQQGPLTVTARRQGSLPRPRSSQHPVLSFLARLFSLGRWCPPCFSICLGAGRPEVLRTDSCALQPPMPLWAAPRPDPACTSAGPCARISNRESRFSHGETLDVTLLY